MDQQVRYEFQLAEQMSPTAACAFPELHIRNGSAGATLFGPVRDRAELYGFLDRFDIMGLTVLEVHRLPD